MAAGFNYVTDLYEITNTIQNTMIRYPKDSIIASLKEFFEKDSRYHYQRDEWGYPKTPDLTGTDSDAGLNDDVTTRVFIGEKNRYNKIFYPAILVTAGNFRYVPISMSRDRFDIEYNTVEFVDQEGNRKFVNQPAAFIPSGAWEGTINIDIYSRGHRERDDLAELIMLFMTDLNYQNFYRAGVSIKPTEIQAGQYSEQEDYNDKLYRIPISVGIRGEWARKIPINTFIDVINVCVEIGNLPTNTFAPNLQINTFVDVSDNFPGTGIIGAFDII